MDGKLENQESWWSDSVLAPRPGGGWGTPLHLETPVQAERVCPPPRFCSAEALGARAHARARSLTQGRNSDAELPWGPSQTPPEVASRQLIQPPRSPVRLTPEISRHSGP